MWEHSLHLNVKFIRSLKIYLENIKDKINSLFLCIEMCISPIAGSVVKNLPALQDWRRQWQPTPVLLPGEPHGRRSLVGCGPWGREESGTTERLHFHFSLSCIGEGNGNPLQGSCLENPRDGGAWWAAVYGVAQSQTRLKRLSSSSSAGYLGSIPGLGRSPEEGNWLPTPVFLPEEFHEQRGLVGYSP